MYESIRVRNFRGFADLRLEGLTRVNLIGGKNNIGKTALLEALLLLNGVFLGEIITNLRRIEGIEKVGEVLPIEIEGLGEELGLFFYQADLEKIVEITGQRPGAIERTLKIRGLKEWASEVTKEEIRRALIRSRRFWPEDFLELEQPIDQIFLLDYREGKQSFQSYVIIGKTSIVIGGWTASFPVSYRGARVLLLTSKIIGDYGNLEKAGEEEIVVQLLRVIEPRLERLTTIYDERRRRPTLYGVLKGFPRRVPLHVMGDGMIRLVDLAIRLGNAQNGILLVDEFENGLHWSVLPQVWRAFKDAARRLNVQVFATTHSYECIQAAHQAFSEDALYDFRFYRLERTEQEGIQAVAFDRETLSTALEMGWEVR